MRRKKMDIGVDQTKMEITPLNKNLFNEFKIEELEERYETDPLMLLHLFGLNAEESENTLRGCACNKISDCPELECGARNK